MTLTTRTRLATAALALTLGALPACDAGADPSCADSAFHVLACTGSEGPAVASSCDPVAAKAVMKEDCDGINTAVGDGKQDGAWSDVAGYLCVHLGIPEFCE